MKKEESSSLFTELNILMILSIFTGSLGVLIIIQDLKLFLSFLFGALLAYLNFYTLKREGSELLFKVYNNVMFNTKSPYQKERIRFLINTFLRLLALGIIFYFLIKKVILHPIFLLLGFTLVYLQIFVVIIRFWLKKRESF